MRGLAAVNGSGAHNWSIELNEIIKRSEDLVLGVILLAALLPLMIVVALCIKLDSPGPVLFSQPRRGRHLQIYTVWKFRSMYVEMADELCVLQTVRGDRRITRVGSFLRKHSLDELPQLFNVLRGDMSLVGPRPHALATSVDGQLIEEIVQLFPERHRVKPGITGWAQVSGCRGPLDTIEKVFKRVEYDLYYINHWSLWLDLKLLLKTVSCVIRDNDAY